MMRRLFTKTLQGPVNLYRYMISPLIGGRCRYHPTCSAYAIEALEKHGPFKGCVLAFMRILRCHPLSRCNGMDPVPTRFTWRSCFGYKRQHSHDNTNVTKR